MKTVIFDIDGTLADLSHRIHYVTNGNKDWDNFFSKVSKDAPKQNIIDLTKALDDHYKIILVSGRPEKTRADTQVWLFQHNVVYEQLYMRPDGDYRPDDIIKSQILDGILADGHEIAFVVDDRQRVVDMWRERGLTCLQCDAWEERKAPKKKFGLLVLMVGPSGAGKSSWLGNTWAVVSSDKIRAQLCGDFRDQSRNKDVFEALHAVVKARLENGLNAIIDATNIRTSDRLSAVKLAEGNPVKYVVVNRPLEDKLRDKEWRSEELIRKHESVFQSNLKAILAGDNLPNVTVEDLRVL